MDSRILQASLEALAGRIYGRTGADRTDCSRLVWAVLREIYGAEVADYRAEVMIYDAAAPWSPITGLAAAGVGIEVDTPIPGRWHVCQGWRELTAAGAVPDRVWPNGHSWLWREAEIPRPGSSLIVQATTAPPPWVKAAQWPAQAARFPAGVRLVALAPR